MRTIPLSQGKFAIVDDADFPSLNGIKWFYNCGYVRGKVGQSGNKRSIGIHRYILEAKTGEFCDHINGDPLDNRRKNLRICTKAENNKNARIRKDNSSGYRGVAFYKRHSCWAAAISSGGRRYNLGYFSNPKDAAMTYNEAAKHYHSKFAKLNKL